MDSAVSKRAPARLSVSLLTITALAFATASPALAAGSAKWYPWLDVDGTIGTSGRSIGELDAFLPLWQDPTALVFGNARFKGDNEESLEGNFGFGARRMLDNGWNLGAYGYFDRRRTPNENYFNQLTFGVEALGDTVDFRANAYLPVGATSVGTGATATLSGASIVVQGMSEIAMKGFDAEIGYRLPVFEDGSPFDIRAYAGGYHFSADNAPDIAGPRIRAELTSQFGNGMRVSFGGGWQRDEVRGSQAFAGLRLRVPLGGGRASSLSRQERRMLDPIVRDVDIVTQAGAFEASEVASKTADGQDITVIDSTLVGYGNSLTDELTAAGANSTVILSGAFNTSDITYMQPGQTLMGSGAIDVKAASGRTATLTTSDAMITGTDINGLGGGATIEMASDSTLMGMTVIDVETDNGGNSIGVIARNASNARILNNRISVSSTSNVLGSSQALLIISSTNVEANGNALEATHDYLRTSLAIQVADSSASVIGNRLSAQNSNNTALHTRLLNATILAGSTGNEIIAGMCFDAGGNTGTIGYTDNSSCP